MVFQKQFRLISKEKLKEDIFRLKLFSPEITRKAQPGNFVHIRVNQNTSPLLRRAFSICNLDRRKKSLDLLFKVVGLGTKILSEKKAGESLDVLGPLGNSFVLPSQSQNSVMVAGGMGIAPLLFLAVYLVKNKKYDPQRINFFYGEGTKNKFICLDELKKLKVKTHLATEDGSRGFKGTVTELFLKNKEITSFEKDCFIYTCGPDAMMRSMSCISKKYDLFCQLSLESHMPCGLGTCFGCVVEAKSKGSDPTYRRICRDGPIFDAREVELD